MSTKEPQRCPGYECGPRRAIDAALRLASELDAEDGYDASDGQALGRSVSRGDRIREAITAALLDVADVKP